MAERELATGLTKVRLQEVIARLLQHRGHGKVTFPAGESEGEIFRVNRAQKAQ